MEAIIYICLRESVSLYDVLRGFLSGRRAGTAILELNLAQELDIFDQDPLLLVFLDLQKAYNTVYQGRLMTTLEGYGSGPHM